MTTAHSHRAIIATMRDSQTIEEIIALRDEMPVELQRHLVGPLNSSHNLYVTFVMIPHGTAYDDDLGEWCRRLATLLRSALTRPSLAVDMVDLEYGGDSQQTIVHETFDAKGVTSHYS